MRASKLPLAAKCRKSATLNTYGSDASNLGTAFHELAKDKVLGTQSDLESVRSRYGLSRADMDGLLAAVYNIEINIPTGAKVISDDTRLTSRSMDNSGQPDLGIIKDNRATIIDWKSGWNDVEDPEINLQLIDYAVLVMENYPEVETFDLLLVLPRQNRIKAHRYSRDDLERRAKDIKQIIEEAGSPDAEYTVGSHCQSCFGCMACPAFAGEVERFAALAKRKEIDTYAGNIRESLKLLLPFAKLFKTVSSKIERVAKAYVDVNGPLDIGGGQYVKTVEERENILSDKAVPVLEKYFGEDISDMISISKTAVRTKAQAKGRGEYKKVYDQLVDKGAIEKKPMVVYRIQKGAVENEPVKRVAGKQVGSPGKAGKTKNRKAPAKKARVKSARRKTRGKARGARNNAKKDGVQRVQNQ